MAKPTEINLQTMQKALEESQERTRKAEAATKEYQSRINKASLTSEAIAELQDEREMLAEECGKLSNQKAELERWFDEFQKTKRSELESELRDRRTRLMAEIKELEEQKKTEEESVRDLLTAQELNQRQAQRQAESIAKQLSYLREQREFCKRETERLNREAKGLKDTRLALNKRSAALDTRESKLDLREEDMEHRIREALGNKRKGEDAFAKAKAEGAKWGPIQAQVEADKRAIQQERANLRNETARAEARLQDLQREYEALSSNINSLENREKRVNKAIRALKRKGIDLEAEL